MTIPTAVTEVLFGVPEADLIRWVGVVVGVIGAAIAASNGVRMVASGLVRWLGGTSRWLFAHLAKWVPFLRKSAHVQALAGVASAHSSLGAVVIRGIGWNPDASVEEKVDVLHNQLDQLRQEMADEKRVTTERHAELARRVDAIDAEWREAVATLTRRLDATEQDEARTDARGLWLIAVGIILTGIPDGLSRWAWLGWTCVGLAILLTGLILWRVTTHPASATR